jgi:predicted regulator of Ras-like GTPase activity (Roadblock/LC7/MglB family)
MTIASDLPHEVEEDRVSAMSAALLSIGNRIAEEFTCGALDQMYIHGNRGYVLLMAAGNEAVLTALAQKDAKLGLVFLDLRCAAADIVRNGSVFDETTDVASLNPKGGRQSKSGSKWNRTALLFRSRKGRTEKHPPFLARPTKQKSHPVLAVAWFCSAARRSSVRSFSQILANRNTT